MIYLITLKPAGKIIQFGLNALLLTHLVHLFLFWRRRLQINRIKPLHNKAIYNPVYIQNRPLFRMRYLELFPIPLTSLSFMFIGLKIKHHNLCSEWANDMFQKYYLGQKLYAPATPIGEEIKDPEPIKKALIAQSELLFEQRCLYRMKFAWDFSVNKSSLYEQNNLIS